MAGRLNRGEIWLLALPRPDKHRPVLVLSRPSLLGALNTVTVAAVTSTRRGAPTDVHVGPDEGLKGPSCVNRHLRVRLDGGRLIGQATADYALINAFGPQLLRHTFDVEASLQ